jgi:hypothetical protein
MKHEKGACFIVLLEKILALLNFAKLKLLNQGLPNILVRNKTWKDKMRGQTFRQNAFINAVLTLLNESEVL